MNRLMATKKSTPKASPIVVQSGDKRPRREKNVNPPVTKKYKSSRSNTSKVKKVAKNAKLMNEWAENESSKAEICERPRQTRNVKKTVSTESVIYVGSYKTCDSQRSPVPVIDLTESADHITMNKENFSSKKLKTLYFPERNFVRVSRLNKRSMTTSLITIPVTKKTEIPAKHPSTTELTNKIKLAVLDIPAQNLEHSDINLCRKGRAALEKANLTESDYEMIDWIIENDQNILNRDVDMGYPLSPSTSPYDSSVNTGMSLDEFVKMYDTTSDSEN
nr:uncharacterized protein LOC111508827 [Leptinotarsa decemlineata]